MAALRNKDVGHEEGYDCPDCLNRGYFARVNPETLGRYVEECKCMPIRRGLEAVRKSGLAEMIERYRFDNWQAKEPWQQTVYDRARAYAKEPGGSWYMMAGRPGSGKTHLCTAVCNALMMRGKLVRYMLWRDVSVRAKACVNEESEYSAIVGPLKRADVLYIDDFFKAGKDERGSMKVTPADVSLAFEILNHRYNDPKKLTIISTELSVEDILNLDEAVGSRIYERTKGHYVNLKTAKNWRLT